MVAHLHPRSRSTLSLFNACLAISFLVVGAPHVLPCPVDRTQTADSATDASGEPRRRRRRKSLPDQESAAAADEDTPQSSRKRECPVPKPGGLIGQVMGFPPNQERPAPTPTIIVQSLRDRHARDDSRTTDDERTS